MALPNRIGGTILILLLLCAKAPLAAETNQPGVTGDMIAFAQSSCFSGVCGTTGLRYRAGIRAAFHERNLRGGVKGRKLRLTTRDDAYDPETAAANAALFASDRDIFAVIGGLGTPTALRMAPVLRNARVPFVGILSGASFLQDRARFPNIVNLRTGYAEEARKLVAHMHGRLGARRFGVIFQDDAFGYTVLANYREALKALGLPILAKASYSWHSHSIHSTLFVMEKADLDVVLMGDHVQRHQCGRRGAVVWPQLRFRDVVDRRPRPDRQPARAPLRSSSKHPGSAGCAGWRGCSSEAFSVRAVRLADHVAGGGGDRGCIEP